MSNDFHHRALAQIPNSSWRSPLEVGICELLKARLYAEDADRDTWEFAVEIDRLRSVGLTPSDLRWLVCREYVEHASEETAAANGRRAFRAGSGLTFSKRTCFVLTKEGVAFAHELIGSSAGPGSKPSAGSNGSGLARRPVWDSERHELRVGDLLIKRFKWPAINQVALLAAFQEEEWPARIDDPLPPRPEQDPKRRLHDTIKCLNRNQQSGLIHFRGDGTGEGVVWEFVDAASG
jgi:hypothetical protein